MSDHIGTEDNEISNELAKKGGLLKLGQWIMFRFTYSLHTYNIIMTFNTIYLF